MMPSDFQKTLNATPAVKCMSEFTTRRVVGVEGSFLEGEEEALRPLEQLEEEVEAEAEEAAEEERCLQEGKHREEQQLRSR